MRKPIQTIFVALPSLLLTFFPKDSNEKHPSSNQFSNGQIKKFSEVNEPCSQKSDGN